MNIYLQGGTNTVSLIYDSSKGSANYLNLDTLFVLPSTYEAESGVLHALGTESTFAGYTGSGYVNNWNKDSEWVDFNVYETRSGTHTITLRYAAGAGNASRYIYVNGSGVVANQSFPGTGNWSQYKTVTVSGVALNAGLNTVSVIYNSLEGSSNYLNLDNMVITP